MMSIKVNVQPKNNYIFVEYKGHISVDITREILRAFVESCKESGCLNILVHAFLTNHLSTMEIYNIKDLFIEEGITFQHRIAWVELNMELFEHTYFAETILHNRGLSNARLFTDKEEAEKWLLSD